MPSRAPRARVDRRSFETDAMLGSASPRKPNVVSAKRSSLWRILLVAWRWSASTASSSSMPAPSSVTRMRVAPPRSSSTLMRVAPASSAFSTSSLTTLAGRSTTSPAAIWFARSVGSVWIRPIAAATAPSGLRCAGSKNARVRRRVRATTMSALPSVSRASAMG